LFPSFEEVEEESVLGKDESETKRVDKGKK